MKLKEEFANAWDLAEAAIVIAGVVLAFSKVDRSYLIFAFGSLFLVMGLEPVVKGQIVLRGKIFSRSNNPASYYSMVSVYLIGAAICFIVAFI